MCVHSVVCISFIFIRFYFAVKIFQSMFAGLAQQRLRRVESTRFTLRYPDVSRSGWIAPWSLQEFFITACAASESMRLLHAGGLVYPQIHHTVSMLIPSDDDMLEASRITDFQVDCGLEIIGTEGSTLHMHASFDLFDVTRPEWRRVLGELVAVAVCVKKDNFERTNVPVDRICLSTAADTAAIATAANRRLTWPPPQSDPRIEEVTSFTIQPWHEDALQHVTNHMHSRFLWSALQKALPQVTPGATVNFSIQFRKQVHAGQMVRVVLATCLETLSAVLMRGDAPVCIAEVSVQPYSKTRSAL